MTKIEALTAKNAELAASMEALAAAAEAESRNLTPEEDAQFKSYDGELKANENEIANLQRLEEIKQKQVALVPRVVQPMDQGTSTPLSVKGSPNITGGGLVAHNYRNHGFTKGPGEFLLAVYRAGAQEKRVDPRLMVDAISTWGGETVGGDGGFALPPDFVRAITDAVMPGDSFLGAMNPVQTNSNLLTVPVNENAPWASTGITSAKTAEGGTITASKPAIKQVQVVMYKAASLVHVSEESLSDMPFLASWVMGQMGQHLRYQLENWLINGSGVAEPLGVLNAACTVALSDADSTASAIGAVDVLQMEATLLPGSGGFYVGNPTVFPAIASMKTGSAGYPLFQPDMTLPSRRALLGRPFYISEACPILNVTGDLILIQPSGYVFAQKAGGVQTATTIGFAFDQDLQSFRATMRVGGAPTLSAKVARAKSAGSTYASNFVVITGGRS